MLVLHLHRRGDWGGAELPWTVTLTARPSHSSPTRPLAALLDLRNWAWYRTVVRKPSSPTSVMRFPGDKAGSC